MEVQSAPAFGMPAGVVVPYAGATVPAGWLLCFGQLVSTTTYAALFAVLSTTYGSGSGLFGIPDLRGRAAFGKDDMGGSAANKLTNAATGGINGAALGNVGGEQAHTLTSPGELPGHQHDLGAHVHGPGSGSSNFRGTLAAQTAPTTTGQNVGGFATTASPSPDLSGSVGSGGGHNTVPPGIVLNYIICTGGP